MCFLAFFLLYDVNFARLLESTPVGREDAWKGRGEEWKGREGGEGKRREECEEYVGFVEKCRGCVINISQVGDLQGNQDIAKVYVANRLCYFSIAIIRP